MNDKVIGILGGMGPYATILLQKNIFDLTPATKDWEHIRTVVDNNTHIPSRTRAVMYNETSPLAGMIDCCKQLQNYPVDIITVPCNSACYWIPEIRKIIKTPIISIIDIALEALGEKVTKVGILGGSVTYIKNLYQPGLEELNLGYCKPDFILQNQVVSLIESIKLNGDSALDQQNKFQSIVEDFIRTSGADSIILACTELSEFKDVLVGVPVIDSSSLLAKFIVDFARGERCIPLNTRKIKDFWKQRAEKVRLGDLELLQSSMLSVTTQQAKSRDEQEKIFLFKKLDSILKQNFSLLELGCGYGRWSFPLSSCVKKIDAYDYCQEYINLAEQYAKKNNIKNINFICNSVEDLVLNKKYNCVISIGFLHYLSDAQFYKVMRMIKQGVSSSGFAVFRESFGKSKRFELHDFYSEVLGTGYHAVYRTEENLIESLGDDFSAIHSEVFLPATDEKPETYQKLIIFQRKR